MEKLASGSKSFLIVAVCKIMGPGGRHWGVSSQLGSPHNFPLKTPHQQWNCLPGYFPYTPAGRQRAQKKMTVWHSISVLSKAPGCGWGSGWKSAAWLPNIALRQLGVERAGTPHSSTIFLSGHLDPVRFILAPTLVSFEYVCKGKKERETFISEAPQLLCKHIHANRALVES